MVNQWRTKIKGELANAGLLEKWPLK